MTQSVSAMNDQKAALAIRNLNFYYGKFHGLKNINLDIFEG